MWVPVWAEQRIAICHTQPIEARTNDARWPKCCCCWWYKSFHMILIAQWFQTSISNSINSTIANAHTSSLRQCPFNGTMIFVDVPLACVIQKIFHFVFVFCFDLILRFVVAHSSFAKVLCPSLCEISTEDKHTKTLTSLCWCAQWTHKVHRKDDQIA